MKFISAFTINSDNITLKSFGDALLIWIKKPHVVNRRLLGAEILTDAILNKRDLIKLRFECSKCGETDNIMFVRPLNDFLLEQLLKCIDKIYNELENDDETTMYHVFVRHLIPKATNIKYDGLYELIIQNMINKDSYFLYLCSDQMNFMCTNIKNPTTNSAYKISLSSDMKSINLFVEENYLSTLNDLSQKLNSLSLNWLKDTLLQKISKWSKEQELNTDVKSLILVNIEEYNEVYSNLKAKYGKYLIDIWTENTDPLKYIYEDIGIAAYLLLIWRKYDHQNVDRRFVDVGCGNGLLVYILNSEGFLGYGVDIRSRKIWGKLRSKADLRVKTVVPSEEDLFSDADWLIGNHSDELTPWIPVMAARSKFRKCHYFVIPCCPWDFTMKFSNILTSGKSTGKYAMYLNYINEVGEVCGFKVFRDVLRIPSTRRTCFIGLQKNDSNNEISHEEKWMKIQNFINSRKLASLSSTIKNIDDFKPREPEVNLKNNLNIDRLFIENIWIRVLNELLKTKNILLIKKFTKYEVQEQSHLFDNPKNCKEEEIPSVKNWNKGGIIPLTKISQLFDKKLLNALKSECGGLQTVLKNCCDVFSVREGSVCLRDWTAEEFQDYLKWRRKKNQSNKNYSTERRKTKICFFYSYHPDGCLLENNECRFAHGVSDLNVAI